ncbi:Uncharacterized phage protein gp47/JayE [Pseudoxanthobacter soli DSM 19599]|uniref:Uncharacterized phage protein gp47/JayE n=1 Tax=Pseudoxanthobacter soli DSM 19599 TaxID=1123029 RepID=A0A1M7ZLN3_9HYPH|nr:baseplate J/gp47 family protein [Pseudoxanthobacter soli]SHO65808.1 Uncharacterized phage protein gp47/JayE [Pseudoxanthobacter soli DSM 19599]
MAFQIETLKQLSDRVRQAFRAEMPGTDAWIWPNNLYVVAKVLGGLLSSFFGRLDYVARQRFTVSADRDGLIEQGRDFGLAPLPPAPATGSAVVSTTGGLTVLAGAILVRADGATYTVTDGGGLSIAGDLVVSVQATAAGAAGNAIAGTALTALSGVSGATGTVVGARGLTGGADVEGTEAFRSRILWRKRYPAQGGAPPDYVEWVKQVAGVTRVYVERHYAGPGTVRLYPLMDEAAADGIPSAESIADIYDVVDALAPGEAVVSVAAAVALPVAVTVSGLSPATSAVEEAVRAELAAMMRREGRVAGTDPGHPSFDFLATPLTLSRSWFWQAAANASGEERHEIVAPAADVVVPAGALPVLGVVTFV